MHHKVCHILHLEKVMQQNGWNHDESNQILNLLRD